MFKVKFSPILDQSHGRTVDRDQDTEVYPDKCTRAKRYCPQCFLEGKLQCDPRIPIPRGNQSRPEMPGGKSGVITGVRRNVLNKEHTSIH